MKKRKNDKLTNARVNRNDEFYSQLKDIESELQHHKEHFADQWIYLPCDTEESNFWRYFKDNYDGLKLGHLTATHINHTGSSYRLDFDGEEVKMEVLQGNGDFRSEECCKIKDKCDIICTNPPFSLFSEFFVWLGGKRFIVMGNLNAICYKDVFPSLRDGRVWLGDGKNLDFILPDGSIKGSTSRWFTNLGVYDRKPLLLTEHYTPDKYPKLDNYDVININRVKDIPVDYDGVMAVPVTFLDKWCADQFEIVAIACGNSWSSYTAELNALGFKTDKYGGGLGVPALNGKVVYVRIMIKRKNEKLLYI